MKKAFKFIFTIFTAIASFSLFACSGNRLTFSVPWINERNVSNAEYSEYEIIIASGEVEQGQSGFEETILARGTHYFEAQKVADDVYSLKSEFKVDFTDGGTGSVVSQSTFNQYFNPISSYKRVLNKDKGYELTVEYGNEIKLTLSEDDGAPQTKTLKQSKVSGAIDNETLFFAMRGISELGASYNASFRQFVGYDYFKSNKSPYTMRVICDGEVYEKPVPADVYSRFILPTTDPSPTVD